MDMVSFVAWQLNRTAFLVRAAIKDHFTINMYVCIYACTCVCMYSRYVWSSLI